MAYNRQIAQLVSGTPLVSEDDSARWRQIVDSDSRYFELAAERIALSGAEVSWMPGLAHVAAGVVIHRVDPAALGAGGLPLLARYEDQLRNLGVSLSRIYVETDRRPLEALLAEAGYVRRIEFGFCGSVTARGTSGLRLVEIEGEALWQAKRELHELAPVAPDGHGADAGDWVTLERRKCSGKEMRCFLAKRGNEVVGSFGLMHCVDQLRLKNILIHPGYRRRGYASELLALVTSLAHSEGLAGISCLAVEGGSGEMLYRKAKMEVMGRLFEWSRSLI